MRRPVFVADALTDHLVVGEERSVDEGERHALQPRGDIVGDLGAVGDIGEARVAAANLKPEREAVGLEHFCLALLRPR